jgi:hypothetical protein
LTVVRQILAERERAREEGARQAAKDVARLAEEVRLHVSALPAKFPECTAHPEIIRF